MSGGWIQTRTGRKVHPLALRPEDVCIEDIAHALAHQCRFTGHTSEHYSVAQHSVHVALRVPYGLGLAGLLHDASEAYLLDLASPLKALPEFAAFKQIEARITGVIEERFGIPMGDCSRGVVKHVDKRMLQTEARRFMAPLHPEFPLYGEPYLDLMLGAWSAAEARAAFLIHFQNLYRGKHV